MKQLIVYCHPNPQSFSHGIMETLVQEFKALNQELRVRDLYSMHFDPALRPTDLEALQKGETTRDIEIEQGHVRWAEVLTFVYPLWWTALPAMVKGYIDRVFSLGFAYAQGEGGYKGLLGGKKVYLITTMGAPLSVYEEMGMIQSMRQTIDQGIGEFCGLTVLGHKYFGKVPDSTDEERQAMLEEVKGIARELAAAS